MPAHRTPGPDAGLLPLENPVWRRPVYARQEGRTRTDSPDPYPVPGRQSASGPVPRLGRGNTTERTGNGAGWTISHQHGGRPEARPPAAARTEEGHAADHHDHRWKAFGAHDGGWSDICELNGPGPADSSGHVSRGRQLPPLRNHH